MSATILHSRGDVHLANQQNLKTGQIFLSYLNTDSQTSNQHSYSEGQLWTKDPSKEALLEIANARSINALRCKGYMSIDFNGDFINAREDTQNQYRNCHEGDFWIFKEDNLESFKEPFYKHDILLITGTTFTDNPDTAFRQTLTDVQYVRIPVSNRALSNRVDYKLEYKGEFSDLQSFYNLERKIGNLFIATKTLNISKVNFKYGDSRDPGENSFIKVRPGDFIWWNGEKWEIIPSGFDATDILYSPDSDKIDSVSTFEDWQKDLLKSTKNVKEALDVLMTTKAQLDANGKVPYAQLPDALKNSLVPQGKFYPVISKSLDIDDPENQRPWPEMSDGSEMLSGYYWIVDCDGQKNVQYQDKTHPGRIVELNTGDWIVWFADTQQFEILDNSDRITSIDLYDPVTFEKKSLTGNVGFIGENLDVIPQGNNVKIRLNARIVTQSKETGDGIPNYFPIYGQKKNELKNSEMYQDLDTIISKINFTVGSLTDAKELKALGNIGIEKTVGATTTAFINNFLFYDTASLLKDNSVFYRRSNIHASERRNFATGNETIDVTFPEASSLLVGILTPDSTTKNYHTMSSFDGFITDTLTSEIEYVDKWLEENFEVGYENIGLGRLASEDIDSGEITFYAKTKDSAKGFYTKLHGDLNDHSLQSAKTEHFLDRENIKGRTHLVINPTILEDEIETFVKMPFVSGTLLTWEELKLAFGGKNGVPLMIPAWEEMNFRDGKFIGLDTSPITIRLNRPAHDNVSIKRTNDLSKDYGTGKQSAFSYIGSSKEGSLQDPIRGSIDDFVSFDAWFEAERAIVSKEAFILPASALKDGFSKMNMYLEHSPDTDLEVRNDAYDANGKNGIFQRVLPSRTLYANDPIYYDPITGELIRQNVTTKDVELPPVGGVLLSNRCRIEGGYWG